MNISAGMRFWSPGGSTVNVRRGFWRKSLILKAALCGLVGWFLVFLGSRYSGQDTYYLILRNLLADQWHVPGSMSCSRIIFQREAHQQGPTFEELWANKFASTEVKEFKSYYLSNCGSASHSIGVLLSSGRTFSPGLGFASVSNFALSVFYCANQASSVPVSGRAFRLYVSQWNYVSWKALFRDFTQDSHCAIVRDLPPESLSTHLNASLVRISFPQANKVLITGASEGIFEQNGPGYIDFYKNLARYENTIGTSQTFPQKSILARALMDPQPDLLATIKTLWAQLTHNGATGFSAVHIRRGDKIANSESINFPILLYPRALRRLCLEKTEMCSRRVFVWCDDAEVCREFQRLAHPCFQVTDYSKLLAETGENRTMSTFHNQTEFNSLPEAKRLRNARELVISLYLSAMADVFICTYSSNICRLVALLRGGVVNQNGVLSLDWLYWNMY